MDTDHDIAAELRTHLGDDAVGDDTGAFAIAGRSPACVVSPASVVQVREVLSLAHERRLAVVPCGNGTHLHVGSPPARYDIALSLRRLSRVVAHEAADMTVTVEAGASLAALNSRLAATGQWLPFDPPRRDRVTIGGLIAGDLNGPLRLSQGKVRDSLIGITVVLADGAVVKGGGKVVKNVAGYDLAKLFTGSAGTLGVIVEATFKIRPRPEATRIVWLPAENLKAAWEVAAAIAEMAVAPLFLEIVDVAAATEAGLGSAGVAVGLGGIAEELEAQQAVLSRLPAVTSRVLDEDEASRVGDWLRDFPCQSPVTARVSLLPTGLLALLPRVSAEAAARRLAVQFVVHAGNGVARAHIEGDEAQAVLFCEWLRITVREHGGWVVFDRLADGLHGRVDPFGNPGSAVLLMQGIKHQLDPDAVLSPGRFVGGI
jgi:glycolate oxidase FAD binding subunit